VIQRVNGPVVELCESTAATIIADRHPQYIPRWSIRNGLVIVGGFHSRAEWEDSIRTSVGSADYNEMGHDEFRFRRTDLLLQGVRLFDNENDISMSDSSPWWQAVKPVSGLLRLTSSSPFVCQTSRQRWVASDGLAFACFYHLSTMDAKDGFRLRIAQDFDLLFAKGKLCGWMLSHPARYLVNSWADPYPDMPDAETVAVLHEYMTLVGDASFMSKVDSEDARVLEKLIGLHGRLASGVSTERRRLLQDYIADIVEKLYDRRLS